MSHPHIQLTVAVTLPRVSGDWT